jgi:hypothetical protein
VRGREATQAGGQGRQQPVRDDRQGDGGEGKKQRRLAKQAVAIAKKTLRSANGKKGNAIPDACREGLRGFLQATQTEVGTATH